MNDEERRLAAPVGAQKSWKEWGPYLSERQWGTVREDYTRSGDAWNAITHDMSRHYAYRWGEDGIGGFSDHNARICFSLALWNGQDDILKERLFGLSNPEGNHGEDVKELYYYLDATPTHSYGKMLYKYPHSAFPYSQLVAINRMRGKKDPEFEIEDTGAFKENRYFDIEVEHAKSTQLDIHIRISATNHGPEEAPLWLIPQVWFRNTWSSGNHPKPHLKEVDDETAFIDHEELDSYLYHCPDADELIYCDNETDRELIGIGVNKSEYSKNSFHKFICESDREAVNPNKEGTKVGAVHRMMVQPGETRVITVRLRATSVKKQTFPDEVFAKRIAEADEFYEDVQKGVPAGEQRKVQRQALAGLLWSKQYYYYNVAEWLDGDDKNPAPPEERLKGRNNHWRHLINDEIISMPDKWEYPWYAAWDLAFHCIPLALVDTGFAKKQLQLMLKEWYMHPNGQIPAYEWHLSDVNPPVHAWGVRRVYQMEQRRNKGRGDLDFLEECFHKLLINFTWWINRKDAAGNNIFQGGFLGLDNIGVFDRSSQLPTGGHLSQADGTAWMGFYSLQMMQIALELALHNPVYEKIANKFFEHFLSIAGAITSIGHEGRGLWDEKDGFFYDALNLPGGEEIPLKVRSMVGLIPLYAVEVISSETLVKLPRFHKHMLWVLENKPELAKLVPSVEVPGEGRRRLLSLVGPGRLERILERVFDPNEFLSDYGIRALSKAHEKEPYVFDLGGGQKLSVAYLPAESDSDMFGGNSNWRGPVWFPVNYLLYESLQKFHYYFGDDFIVPYPTGSKKRANLEEISRDLGERLTKIFLPSETGERPVYRHQELYSKPGFNENILFFEYFHGDNGRGIGASHQTGWTGLVAKLFQSINAPLD